VRDLLTTGPQTVLVIDQLQDGKLLEIMIPFVAAYIDDVSLSERRILVDWQADY
jgi:16S rRNA processing protein RimM